jgi:hypothetical protein
VLGGGADVDRGDPVWRSGHPGGRPPQIHVTARPSHDRHGTPAARQCEATHALLRSRDRRDSSTALGVTGTGTPQPGRVTPAVHFRTPPCTSCHHPRATHGWRVNSHEAYAADTSNRPRAAMPRQELSPCRTSRPSRRRCAPD